MLSLIASFLSLFIAWLSNFLFSQLLREKAAFTAPVIEESAKTSMAVFLGGSVLLTHFTFGLVEAVWDIYNSRKLGVTAAVLSIGGHFSFGLISEYIFLWRSNVLYAVIGGIALHLIWNFIILHLIKLVRIKE